MECKNCGASYKLSKLRCPYCESENLIGKMLLLKRSETIKQYEREQKEAKVRYIPYVASKLVNTMLLFSLLMIVILGVLFTGFNGENSYASKLYNEGRFMELHDYMSSFDMFQDLPKYMSQAALLAYDYNEFLSHRMAYVDDDPNNWDPTYISLAMKEAMDIYILEVGVYSGEFRQNEEMYKEYRERIMAFWRGTMLCDDEDIAFLTEPENFWHQSHMTEMAEKLKERRIEKDGK